MRTLRPDDIPLFVDWERTRPYPWTDQNFRETLSSSSTTTYVWEEEKNVCGFAVVQLIGDEVYLQNIMVAPSFRRRGVAEKMLQKVMMWAKDQGAKELLLDVESTNEAAVALYKKLGMSLLECRKKSYPRGEDAFVMRGVL